MRQVGQNPLAVPPSETDILAFRAPDSSSPKWVDLEIGKLMGLIAEHQESLLSINIPRFVTLVPFQFVIKDMTAREFSRLSSSVNYKSRREVAVEE